MKPIHWLVTWIDPTTGQPCQSAPYYQRAAARGAAMMARAQGMQSVDVKPIFQS